MRTVAEAQELYGEHPEMVCSHCHGLGYTVEPEVAYGTGWILPYGANLLVHELHCAECDGSGLNLKHVHATHSS